MVGIAKEEKKTKLKIKCKTDKSGNKIKKTTNKGKIKNEVNTIKVSTKITNEYGDTAGLCVQNNTTNSQ